MPRRWSYSYALLRVVPRVEREEFVNAGVVLFCADRGFLDARVALDAPRLLSLAPDADVALARRHLDAIARVCAGGTAAGPIGALAPRERWRWLTAPRSTVVQTSAAHAGRCDDPARELDRLTATLVTAATRTS